MTTFAELAVSAENDYRRHRAAHDHQVTGAARHHHHLPRPSAWRARRRHDGTAAGA